MSTNRVGIVLGMRQFRTGLIVAGSVAVLTVGGVITFHILDERRAPATLPQGVIVDHSSCMAREVLAMVIPVPVRPLESLTDTLPPAGTIPEDFQPISAVVCEFLGYAVDNNVAILRQTQRSGDLMHVVTELKEPSLKAPWFDECPTASSVPTPVVWLVDGLGNAVRVAFPVDGTCGLPLPDAYSAVMDLAVQDEQLYYLPRAV